MAHISLRNTGSGTAIEGGRSPAEETSLTAPAILPAVDALRAVGANLAEEDLEAAWVDLENAELELRCEESRAVTPRSAVTRALDAVEQARESLGLAETSQASASIDKAILVLTRAG